MKNFIMIVVFMLMFSGCFIKGNVKVTDGLGNTVVEVETPAIPVTD